MACWKLEEDGQAEQSQLQDAESSRQMVVLLASLAEMTQLDGPLKSADTQEIFIVSQALRPGLLDNRKKWIQGLTWNSAL